jgi:hypothetical protein
MHPGQIRGLGAESPVFLRRGRKKMCQHDRYGRKKVNDVTLPVTPRRLTPDA